MRAPILLIVVGAALHLLARHPIDCIGTATALIGAIWIMELAIRGGRRPPPLGRLEKPDLARLLTRHRDPDRE